MTKAQKSSLEFIALMASLMAMAALAIDAILPAMSVISNDVGSSDLGSSQLLIIMVFLGLGFGQLIFGPLSDSFGRKPLVFIGFIIFIIASFVCIYATSFEMMIFGRVLQGSFMLYLSASQQIFQDQYGLVDEFPLIFAGLAVAFGVSTFLNGKLVMFFGMKKLIKFSLISFTFSASVYLLLFLAQPNPPIEVLCFFLALEFVSLGFLFGNLKSISLQPIGHIAGIGAALTGFISTLFAVPISAFLGSFITGSVYPMFAGFFFCGFFYLFLFFKLNSSNVRFFTIKKS